MILRSFFSILLAAATAVTGLAQAQQQPSELARLQKDFPVTLYTSTDCNEACGLARGALNKRGVPFKEVPVGDTDSIAELKRKAGAVEVPALLVGRLVQLGFEQGAFDDLLDSAGYPKAGVFPARSQKAPVPAAINAPAAEGDAARPVAQGAKAAVAQPAAGRYDASGLTGPEPRRGQYDPSGLTGPAPKSGPYDPSGLSGPPPKSGRYGIPGESK